MTASIFLVDDLPDNELTDNELEPETVQPEVAAADIRMNAATLYRAANRRNEYFMNCGALFAQLRMKRPPEYIPLTLLD